MPFHQPNCTKCAISDLTQDSQHRHEFNLETLSVFLCGAFNKSHPSLTSQDVISLGFQELLIAAIKQLIATMRPKKHDQNILISVPFSLIYPHDLENVQMLGLSDAPINGMAAIFLPVF